MRTFETESNKTLRAEDINGARACPVLAELFSRYAGKQYGEKTAKAMCEELKKRVGAAFYIDRGIVTPAAHSVTVQAVDADGHTTANGEAVSIWNDAPGGGYSADLVTEKNTIAATTADQLHACGKLQHIYSWTAEAVGGDTVDRRVAVDAIEAARAAVSDYNAAKVDGFEEIRRSF